MCQICTIAVGAGLGLSRWLGVDDVISGIWIGGLILSSSLWFYFWLSKKYPRLQTTGYLLSVAGLTYILALVPLTWMGLLTNKLTIGIAAGSLVFSLALLLDKKARAAKGNQFFNFQKVVFPLVFLLVSSLIAWILTKP